MPSARQIHRAQEGCRMQLNLIFFTVLIKRRRFSEQERKREAAVAKRREAFRSQQERPMQNRRLY